MESQEFYQLISTIAAKVRQRLVILVGLLGLTSGIGYVFADGVMKELFTMVRQVIFVSPAEAFVTKIKVAITIGIILALPILIHGLLGLISSRITTISGLRRIVFTGLSLSLFVGGAAFCLYAVLPVGLQFLLGFATLEMQPLLSAGRFISFVLMCTLVFGLMFELPLIIMLLASLGLLTAETLRNRRRYAILTIFIIAGFVTPSPDVLSQILLAVPLLGLYEIGIFLTRFCKKPVEPELKMPADQQQLFM